METRIPDLDSDNIGSDRLTRAEIGNLTTICSSDLWRP